ncbi:MAG: terminase large subunit [Sporolactobacillus sp.]
MDEVRRYCEYVVSGRIIAGRKLKLACKRHLDDLEKIADDDFPYWYDEEEVRRCLAFVRLLPDVNSGLPFEPVPYQVFIIGSLIGWKTKKGNYARFRTAYISMARTNGKSQLMSAIATYVFFTGRPAINREILICSPSYKQSMHTFKYCQTMARHLKKRSKAVKRNTRVLSAEIKSSRASLVPMASDVSKLDTYHPSFTIIDEWGAMPDRSIPETIQSGQVQNPLAVTVYISTAATDLKNPMYQDYKMLTKVLEGELQLDNYFIAIWEQDSDDEISPDSYDLWEKSNPLMCLPDKKDILISSLKSARAEQLAKGSDYVFMTKNMNRFCQGSEAAFLKIADWRATIGRFTIYGQKCYVGIDLSKTGDTTAIAFVYPYMLDGKPHYFVDTFSFIATKYGGIETVEKRHNLTYRQFEEHRWCRITKLESGVIDIDEIYQWFEDYVAEHHLEVLEICYDNYNFNQLLAKLEKSEHEYTLVPVIQGTKTLNTPTRDFRTAVWNQALSHPDNPILEANVTNAVIMVDNNGMRIDKNKADNKIDAVDAVLDAFSRAIYYFTDDPMNTMSEEEINDYYEKHFTF